VIRTLSRIGTAARVAGTVLLFVALALPATATEVTRVTSPGGVTAWLVSDDTVPLIAVDFAFRGGAAQDPDGKAGLATLTASLLDEGAGDLDAAAFKARLEASAVRLSFDAGRDEITGGMATLASRRKEAFDLLALALGKPRFDAEPFDRIRAQIVAGLVSRSTDPDFIAGHLFAEATFPGHPYGRPTGGTPESIGALTRDDVAAFHRRVFARDTLVVGVVGAISAEDLAPLLDVAFGGLPATATLTPVADVAPTLGLALTATVDEPQTVLRLASSGVRRKDPDYMAAFVMDHILGGGTFSSRLYREIREKRGLAYSVGTNLVSYDHAALMVAATATNPASAGETLSLMKTAFAEMAEKGPTAAELEAAKRYLTGNYALRFDTSSKIAGQLVGLQLEGMPIDYFDRRNGLVEAVTLDDVRRVAKRLLSGPLTTVVVGPPAS
jgi:zinc protease